MSITEERYSLTPGTTKRIFTTLAVGVILSILGVILSMNEDHGHGDTHALNKENATLLASNAHAHASLADAGGEEGHGGDGHHGSAPWLKRVWANLWVNNIYFTGLAIIGLFFVAIQYAASAGWSAGMLRIPMAMGSWIPIAGILMVVSWFIAKGDLFHWIHKDVVLSDQIIFEKRGFFYWPLMDDPSFPVFYFLRMVVFFGLWYLFFVWIRKEMLAEDLDGDTKHWFKARSLSAVFLVIFAVSSSVAAWDWVMSIDTHWFSTMFGWYVFASWWVSGLTFITIAVVLLKDQGYLKIIDANHLHDLGKFIFAFSIFWTYIWFSQFLLIYYANIPEETVYFIQRMTTSPYSWIFFVNLIMNFFVPFLLLMTRDSKRHMSLLKLVAPIVLIGHWFDFYLMIAPGVLQGSGGIGFLEIGMTLIFGSLFVYVMLSSLAKVPLIGKNHPMLKESLHHHI